MTGVVNLGAPRYAYGQEVSMIKYVVEVSHKITDGVLEHVIDGHWLIENEVFPEGVGGIIVDSDDSVWFKGHARYFKDGSVEYD